MWCEVDLVLLFVSYVNVYANVCSSTCMSVFDFALWLNSQIKSVQLKIKGSLWGEWHNNKVFKVPLGLICHGDQTSVVRITEVLQFNINVIPDDSKDSQYSHGSHTKHGKLNPAHKCIKMCWNLKTNVIITGHFCCSESLSVSAWRQSFLLLLIIHYHSHFRRIKTVQQLLSERSRMSNQPLKIYARKTTSYEDETNCSFKLKPPIKFSTSVL